MSLIGTMETMSFRDAMKDLRKMVESINVDVDPSPSHASAPRGLATTA